MDLGKEVKPAHVHCVTRNCDVALDAGLVLDVTSACYVRTKVAPETPLILAACLTCGKIIMSLSNWA